MSEDHKRQLEQQLWNIANTLRGKMDADEFRDYILGFIFYKYLSEKMRIYADEILKEDKMSYLDIKENTEIGQQYLDAIREEFDPNISDDDWQDILNSIFLSRNMRYLVGV